MIFWILWIVGLVITFITRSVITKSLKPFVKEKEHSWDEPVEPKISQTDLNTQIRLYLLVCVCIVLVGGIAVAKFVGMFWEKPLWAQILIGLLPALLTYSVGYLILGLNRFDSENLQICFALVFVLSILAWLFPIEKYNTNVETIENYQTIEWTDSRELLYFCNIPVQNVSGEISGSSGLISGSVSGSIDTTQELTYWYVGENGNAKFATAEAKNSEIKFIEKGEIPYVEIIGYKGFEYFTIDHNIGLELERYPYSWTQYVFHVPETVMQSQLS